ncbi:MAG: MCE family protein [Alphaproteobacteria bacterium]|nr:MCE family protein [Alphaproteobacteria bacterium]
MKQNLFETLVGAVVLAVAGFFLTFAYQHAGSNKQDGYMIVANFPNTDGLKSGGDVMVNGVKVGSVIEQKLITEPGPEQFFVQVAMRLDPTIKLPTDTVAMIASESLLGGKYMSLEIGVDEELIEQDGTGRLTHTQAPLRLDDLIGKLIFSNEKKEDKEEKNSETAEPATTATEPQGMPAEGEAGVVVTQ